MRIAPAIGKLIKVCCKQYLKTLNNIPDSSIIILPSAANIIEVEKMLAEGLNGLSKRKYSFCPYSSIWNASSRFSSAKFSHSAGGVFF